ncbi:MAG: SAM-dependent methyltransferase [Eubacteriales bacterium]
MTVIKGKASKYSGAFLRENMMGPNPLMMLEEILEKVPLTPGMRVLDLGCGNGLTSIFLAKEYGVQVFALDLWISATENYQRFEKMGLENCIIPIHGDANDMPFAEGYFDAVISVDSYHYVGNNDVFFHEKIRPLLKRNGWIALAIPGMKFEVHQNVPGEMKPYWEEEALTMWHSMGWWKPKFQSELDDLKMWELACFDGAWRDWLSCENPYAVEDRAMMKADGGKYMNLIGITGVLK